MSLASPAPHSSSPLALLPPEAIRAARAENPKTRARDLAETLGISEAQLVAADLGQGVTRITAQPDLLMPLIPSLGTVMALTRNRSCVHERVGQYEAYSGGEHAAMVLGAEIDLRIFPAHWHHGFALDQDGKRSLQIFDAAGDAVHKIHLRETSDQRAFEALRDALQSPDQGPIGALPAPQPTEAARIDPARTDMLRAEWDKLTDTHQFLRMTRKLKLNRLGAYRMAGAPWVRPLALTAIADLLAAAAAEGVAIMVFVGNAGCIQIHSGPVERIMPMGPWINVLDPRFDMHLRQDHLAEVYCVTKPSRQGPVVSVEAFDAAGALILQIFGKRGADENARWNALLSHLGEPA